MKLHQLQLHKTIRINTLCILALTLIAWIVPPGSFAKDRVYKVTVQSAFPRGDVSVPLMDVFAESAAKRSNGQLKLEWFAAPEIVPPEQLLDSVKMGVLEMQGPSVGAYWAGTMPIGDVAFGLPMSFNMPWVTGYKNKANALQELFFSEGLIDVMREAYAEQGHYYLGTFTSGPIVVLSTKPVKTLEDWKGMKIRADGQNMGYYETTGAKATTLPGTEAYLALKLGTVDMSEWDISAITSMNWHEVAPYWVTGMETYLVMEFTVSLDFWNQLPKHLQEAMAGAYQDYRDAAIEMYSKEFDRVDELVKQKKVIVSEIDQASREFFLGEAEKLWDAQAKKDPASAKAIAIIKKWIAKNSK